MVTFSVHVKKLREVYSVRKFDLPITKNDIKTKKDLQEALSQILNLVKGFYSKGNAHLRLGNTSAAFTDSIAEMEGFSRLLWGLVPLMAGGGDHDIWSLHFKGIKNGTDPAHEEYWGDIHDYDQRMVEMAAFGLALALIPDKVWHPLSTNERNNLTKWLQKINDHYLHDCNWLFFRVLVNIGLKNVGEWYDYENIEKDLQRIDEFYLENGWYADGIGGHVDYYIPFAIHYYSLIYAKLMNDDDPDRSNLYKKRASIFAKDFIYWFAKDGSAVPYGRSLTYRFAQSAFWSAMIFAEVEEPFSYGVMKGMLFRNLRWWFQQPIFNSDGSLTIGYRYPNLIMAENYNSPGSPYWALKTFLILSLKDDHPFWKSEELGLPSLKEKSVQDSPHLILCRQEAKDHVVAFNTGHLSTNEHTHTSAKYEKFAYSNLYGFSVPRAEWGLEQGAFDSMLALSEGDNIYRVKRECKKTIIENDVMFLQWNPWFNVHINTWIIPGLPWHIRIHCINTERDLDFAEGGFALGIENESYHDQTIDQNQVEKGVLATLPWGSSGIKQLYGNGDATLIHPNANTNLIHSRTIIPTIKGNLKKGMNWLVSAVYAEPGSEATHWLEAPQVEVENNQLTVFVKDEVVFQKDVTSHQSISF